MAKPKGPSLQCVRCGGSFHVPPVRALTAKYCSARCKYDDREAATKISHACPQCGKEFLGWKAQARKYCSYECSNLARSKKVKKLCAYCGESFEVKQSEDDVCCSLECRNARSKTEVWPTRTRQRRNCNYCGLEFWARPSQIAERGAKFCSPKCMGFAKRKKTPPPPPHFYNYTYWKQIRQTVLERDSNACKQCGFSGRSLHVHHIIEKRNGGGEELSNLVTLCNPCHQKTHGKLKGNKEKVNVNRNSSI